MVAKTRRQNEYCPEQFSAIFRRISDGVHLDFELIDYQDDEVLKISQIENVLEYNVHDSKSEDRYKPVINVSEILLLVITVRIIF